MKFVCISDTHKFHRQIKLPKGDCLIHCGDMTGRGNYQEFADIGLWLKEQKDKFKYRILIAGNHDFGFEFSSKTILRDLFDDGVIYLENSGIEIEGINIWGSPYTPQFYNWAFMDDDINLIQYWQKIPENTDLLITHGPPYSILDKNREGENCGSRTLYQTVKNRNIKHHVFGHIHEAYGKEKVENTTFHNAASCNRNYECINKPVTFSMTKRKK